MRFAPAQLAAELLRDGHEPQVIIFKKQEQVRVEKLQEPNADFSYCDLSSVSYQFADHECLTMEWGLYKTTKPHELRHLKTCLTDFNPDAIGITCLTPGMSLAEEVITFIREHFTQPILWGGVGATVEPERAIKNADLVCVGEGEEVLREVARKLDAKAPINDIAGTWFKTKTGDITKHPQRASMPLDSIAIPVYDPKYYVQITGRLFNYNPVHLLAPEFQQSYPIMTQRGCPFSCSFCIESFYQDTFGKKNSLKRRNVQIVLDELHIAKTQGYKGISFFDDVFTVNPRWLKEFLPRYKEEIGLPFWCYTYPTTHNPEVLKMLKDAGCTAITMGIQSGSERILTEVYTRPTKPNRVLVAAQELADSGIRQVAFDMIPRTDFDTEEDLKLTLDLLLQLPKKLRINPYSKLSVMPNYPINNVYENKDLLARSEHLSEDVYRYYFKLFYLARSETLAKDKLEEIIADSAYRQDHKLLNIYLPETKESADHQDPVLALG